MVGRVQQLTVGELGQLLGLLTKYQDNLIYEAHEGVRLDEDPHVSELRNLAMERVRNCIKIVADELRLRLTEY